jgi:hypothetical protein
LVAAQAAAEQQAPRRCAAVPGLGAALAFPQRVGAQLCLHSAKAPPVLRPRQAQQQAAVAQVQPKLPVLDLAPPADQTKKADRRRALPPASGVPFRLHE